jgi:hypothetical protein
MMPPLRQLSKQVHPVQYARLQPRPPVLKRWDASQHPQDTKNGQQHSRRHKPLSTHRLTWPFPFSSGRQKKKLRSL